MKAFPGALIVAFLALFSGYINAPRNHMSSILDDVESCINERPDSALAVLRAMDMNSLHSHPQRARAALLHQTALDKCYIDITSDSILAPAVRWYLRFGTADQKLKTWYYRSVLARNAGDTDTQMACLIRAEQYIPKANDPLMAGFIYTAKRVVFLASYDIENALIEAEKAAAAFQECDAQSRYRNALISLVNLYSIQELSDQYEKVFSQLSNEWDELSGSQKGSLGAIHLNYLSRHSQLDTIQNYISFYLSSVPKSYVKWVSVANAYLAVDDIPLAEQALFCVSSSQEELADSLPYLLVKSKLLEHQGDSEASLEVYQQYNRLSDKRIQQSIDNNIGLRQEMERSHLVFSKLSVRFIISIVVTIFLLVAGFFVIRSLRGKKKAGDEETLFWQREYDRVQEQIKRLKVIINHEERTRKIDPLLVERLNKLNQYSICYLQGQKADCQRLSEELFGPTENEKEIFSSLYPTFSLVHRDFIEHLTEKGLNQREIECCCLVYLGLTRKEIAYYLDLNSQYCYNLIASARKKLGIGSAKIDLNDVLKSMIS